MLLSAAPPLCTVPGHLSLQEALLCALGWRDGGGQRLGDQLPQFQVSYPGQANIYQMSEWKYVLAVLYEPAVRRLGCQF